MSEREGDTRRAYISIIKTATERLRHQTLPPKDWSWGCAINAFSGSNGSGLGRGPLLR